MSGVKKRTKRFNYFFLNGLLHKRLHINRGKDEIMAWCYPLKKRVAYTYSDVKRNHEKAWTTVEVAEMLFRKRLTLERMIQRGHITPPQYTYGLNEDMEKYQYLWNEESIMEAHAFLSTVHRGRPRKDGRITPQKLPTVRELRAMVRQEEILYVKGEDGEFRPTWRAGNFD